MRRADLEQFVGALAAPVDRFAREAGLRLVLLINESGQVLAQRGFARALDVMGVASLAAGIHASSHALAVMLGEGGFHHLHHGSLGSGLVQVVAGGRQVEMVHEHHHHGDDRGGNKRQDRPTAETFAGAGLNHVVPLLVRRSLLRRETPPAGPAVRTPS